MSVTGADADPQPRFDWGAFIAAGMIALVVAIIAYDPADWLGFRNLAAMFLGLLTFCFVWPVLAIARLAFARGLGLGVFKTITLWVGLAMFGPSLFVVVTAAHGVYRNREAGNERRLVAARLAKTHDVTTLHEPLSEQETDVVRIDVASSGLAAERQVAVAKQFSRTLIILRALVDRSDVSTEALAAVYDATTQRSAARDVRPEPGDKRGVEAIGAANRDTLILVRELWSIIGRSRNASPALLEEMVRSGNPYARMAGWRNANLPPAVRLAYADSAARSSSVTERALVAADPTTPPTALRTLSADTTYSVRLALMRNPNLPADLRAMLRQ